MLSNNKRTGLRSSQEAVQSEGDTNRAVFAPTSMVLLVLSCDFVWKRTTWYTYLFGNAAMVAGVSSSVFLV